MTFHAWRKTTATVLDEAGATARMIADQLGHSRVSMTQDVYLGRRSRESRVAAALEGVDPMSSGESVGESVGTGAMALDSVCPGQRAGEGTRTPNLLFTRQLRYRLRHASKMPIFPSRTLSLLLRTKPAAGVHALMCAH